MLTFLVAVAWWDDHVYFDQWSKDDSGFEQLLPAYVSDPAISQLTFRRLMHFWRLTRISLELLTLLNYLVETAGPLGV